MDSEQGTRSGDRRAEAIRLLLMAQSNESLAALRTADSALTAVETTAPRGVVDDGWRAALHYVRGVALHSQGNHDAALEAGRSVLRAAESCGDAAWSAVGRAFQVLQATLRAESDVDSAADDVRLQELARAEADIPGSEAEPFAVVTAHTAVAACYLHLRLYELAEPHLLSAAELSAAHPPLMQVTAVIAQVNLAYLHLGWGLELRRVGLDAAAHHSAAARRHAAAAATMDSPEEAAAYRGRAALLAACADSDSAEPHAVIAAIRAGLDDVTALGQRGDTAMAWLFEARALFRAGDLSAALEAARRACTERSYHSIGILAAAAFHTRADLLVLAEPAERTDILAYGDYLAQALWSHRLRALHLARSMQVFERLRRERDSIHALAYTDALTGVGNRHAFNTWVASRAAGVEDEPICLLMVDVDELKAINDMGGHAAGDLILRSIATVLRAQARPGDLVARVGGDEFVVCAELPDSAGAGLARRVVDAVRTALGDTASVSVGVACGPASGAASTLLLQADEAMYGAKRDGGGRVRRSLIDMALRSG